MGKDIEMEKDEEKQKRGRKEKYRKFHFINFIQVLHQRVKTHKTKTSIEKLA